MTFSFCPQCGGKLETKEIGDEGLVPFCVKCSRPFFSFSYPCVLCIVTDGAGNFLLRWHSSSRSGAILFHARIAAMR